MNKFLEKVVALTQAKYMRILTNGFISIAAISIAGSLFTLVKSLPITPWLNFLASSGLGDILSIPISITTDLMGIYVVLGMAHALAKEFGKDPLPSCLVALGAFMLLTPFTSTVYSADYSQSMQASGIIPVSALGSQGIFLAIIVGLTASRLYIFFIDRGWKLKMPDSVPANVAGMFEMMIPSGLTFLVYLIIRWAFSITPYGTAQSFIYGILQTPLMAIGGGAAGALVYLTIAKLLWCFGVHGGMVAYAGLSSIMMAAMTANASAFAAGQSIPYLGWAYTTVLMDFSVLSLTLVMLATAKSKQFKLLGKIGLPTSLFMITEPVVFGTPLVMNPIIDIPFVLLQPVNFLLTMLVSKIGLLAPATGAGINNMIPGPIQLALINGHWTGLVWGCILLVLDFVIYLPFFKVIDKKACKQEATPPTEEPA